MNQNSQIAKSLIPVGTDRWVLAFLVLSYGILYLPSFWTLARSVWVQDEQGHGPIILALAIWLLYSKCNSLPSSGWRPLIWQGYGVLALGLLAYWVGSSQSFLMMEVGSQVLVLTALVLLFLGWEGLRQLWFPLAFLVFMTPFPETVVGMVTGPLKEAVSALATEFLYVLGYPVSRLGVMLNVGQYQLLVADACAGLNSMFTLEALGILYLHLMQYKSVARNVLLAVLIVPIAFLANVVRVIILVLVTYHFGDEAGQGFVHGFAGMVLFLVGLTFVLAVDRALGWALHKHFAAKAIE